MSLTNEDQCWPETVVDNEPLQVMVEKNIGNFVREYAEELDVSLTTTSCHLNWLAKLKWINGSSWTKWES